jgi:glyoxylase-like metal-dependent hydrolase (beta-lactamase superfamily II)
MRLYTIDAENIKLDGGAAFGVVPKLIWEKFVKADENNLIDAAVRCMLIMDNDRLILIDTGCGDKQSEKFYSYLYITGRDNMINSFKKYGFTFDDVTDVILTHLHYDHVGGALKYNSDRTQIELVFKNATYWCTNNQWIRAQNPFLIEKPSYFPENYQMLMESGKLKFIEEETYFTPDIYFKIVNGHTSGQIVPIINYKGRKIAYMADFIASTAHVQLTYIPAFDYQPLISLKEKEEFLAIAVKEDYVLFFEHDYLTECCTLQNTEKGIKVKETFSLEEL